ncbi:transposase [Microseira wollei NIES-4236]|uniref:Transposase n=1 Tax=Microseira wollei NIES-4236 TaxID=2530354 RepID=A0AAV3XQF2_9CYAN|nr:transposase [Microseira wollei NIES-4236]
MFTFDALQLSKKTVELIFEGGNDCVIAVKANQTNLYKQIQTLTQETTPSTRKLLVINKGVANG